MGFSQDNQKIDRSFVPYTNIEEYLSLNTTTRLLQVLFPDEEQALLPDAKSIIESYPKVFCILICIGMGRFITYFTKHALDDHKLPFESTPKSFPTVFGYSDSFGIFYDCQWEFCAPEMKCNMETHFDASGWVLPIISKEEIVERGKAGSAATYKIVLHEAYDKLKMSRGSLAEAVCAHVVYKVGIADGVQQHKRLENHVCALKAYQTNEAKYYYDNEVRAFKSLKRRGRRCRALIMFYGSLVLNGRYNILLEYADGGSLEDYFERTKSPKSGKDIADFWANLCSVIEALIAIHNEEKGGNIRYESPELQGENDFPQDLLCDCFAK